MQFDLTIIGFRLLKKFKGCGSKIRPAVPVSILNFLMEMTGSIFTKFYENVKWQVGIVKICLIMDFLDLYPSDFQNKYRGH